MRRKKHTPQHKWGIRGYVRLRASILLAIALTPLGRTEEAQHKRSPLSIEAIELCPYEKRLLLLFCVELMLGL